MTFTSMVEKIRQEFPVLSQEVNGQKLVYFDNAATAQTPRRVVESLRRFYDEDCANIHRGVHTLSERSTELYEATRKKTQTFLNARYSEEIIFVRGTTEGINLVANAFGSHLGAGDEVIISYMEHHSNIVPWQLLCERVGAVLKVVPVNDAGELDMIAYEALLSERTKLVSVVHVSNSLGTINPVKEITEKAHAVGAKVLLDGAQAVPHQSVDVRDLDCDFYAFSSHKLYGPTGFGVLYGRRELLDEMPPYQGGGDMIRKVTFAKTTYNDLPHKFEAGTPNIAGGIAFASALDFVDEVGYEFIGAVEQDLLQYATAALEDIGGLRMIGTAANKAAVCSFVMDGIHPHDAATLLDHEGIAVRTGHHCTQPLMERFAIPATIRASFAVYNTKDEIDKLIHGLHKVQRMFGN
ncbi:MAG: cysteine desulfurase [Myxococcota bacterium]|nr:cysteine desulfurase [Myxococcota bacterium]